MSYPSPQTVWLTLAIVAVVVIRFLVRELRVRRVPLSRIFVIPAILAAVCTYLIVTTLRVDASQGPTLMAAVLPALAVGTLIGLAVARFTTVRIAPEPGVVLVRGSATTVAIWIVALLLRLAARGFVAKAGLGQSLMLNAALVLMLTVAVTVVRLRILAAARTARPAAP